MLGRPVHLLAAAAVAVASLFSISDASAGCCGGGYYQAPVAYYTAPVVYSYSYAAPAAYASGCGCGGGYASSYANGNGAGYAARPMYTVNQGPAYTDPVVNAEPTPAYDEGYGYSGGYGYRGYGLRGLGYRGLGYRGYGARFGVRGYGLRGYGIRGGYGRFGMQRHRYGAVVPGRVGMRHMGGAIAPRHWSGAMGYRGGMGGGMRAGSVSPMRGGMRRH